MGARISLLIEYIPSNAGTLDYSKITTSLENQGNNISNPQALSTIHKGGIKPFILGLSKLGTVDQGGDGHIFWGSLEKGETQIDNNGRQIGGYYGGFWSLEWSNEKAVFENPISFPIPGDNISTFTLRFDKLLNEFATLINVDGIDYINIGFDFTWKGIESNIHNVIIKKWNKPFKQVKITSIIIGLTIEYDKKYVRRGGKITAGSRKTTDNTRPNFAITPQHGSFQIVDYYSNFEELSQMGILIDGLKCAIFMNANKFVDGGNFEEFLEENKMKMLGNYRISGINFTGDLLSGELVDDILNWDTTWQNGITSNENKTAYSFFIELQQMTPDKINISNETIIYLQTINIPDGFIQPSFLSIAWNTFCLSTATNISKNIRGEIWITM